MRYRNYIPAFAASTSRVPGYGLGTAAVLTGLLSACSTGGSGDDGDPSAPAPDLRNFQQEDVKLRQQYNASTIALRGQVLDASGQPLVSTTVSAGPATTLTDDNGLFELAGLTRRNLLLAVEKPGFYSEQFPLMLRLPANTDSVSLQPVTLQARENGTVRFAFGGDTSFGRRFVDPLEESAPDELPMDNPDALILASDPEPGARAVMQYVKPVYQRADFAVLNFESPLTHNPSTPHPTKEYKFFSLPESALALSWAGIDYVSLGNNHLYDYQEPGAIDTLGTFEALDIPNSGAGLNRQQALTPHVTTLNGSTYSFHSMTSILGTQHEVSYVATDVKGGAANLTENEAVKDAIQTALADSIPIVQLHGGTEYSFGPTAYIESAMRRVAADGAALVIGHHPHVAQGFGREGDTILIHSLGNMAFDQARLETMHSYIAQVDMRADKVSQINVQPIYLEDYRPRPMGGRLGDLLIRRLSEFSHDGLLVYPYAGLGRLATDDSAYRPVDSSIPLSFTIDDDGSAIVDLREHLQSHQYIVAVETAGAALTVQTGRDLIMHGDFEDWDIDDKADEVVRWKFDESSSWACLDGAYRGLQGMCNTRAATNTSHSSISFRNTIRVMGDATNTPIKDLTFLGYFRAENAGAYSVQASYSTSIDGLIFGDEILYSSEGGSHGWQRVESTVSMPDESQQLGPYNLPARGVRLSLRHEPPATDNGRLSFDEVALISWEDSLPDAGLERPHARDFLRISGAPGQYQLTLHYRHLVPAIDSM